jgi:hypothetical protein
MGRNVIEGSGPTLGGQVANRSTCDISSARAANSASVSSGVIVLGTSSASSISKAGVVVEFDFRCVNA